MSRLEELESRIIEGHRAVVALETTGRQRRIEIGADLLEVKKLVGHGRWLPWLGRVGVPISTATDYMREAKVSQPKVGKLPKGAEISGNLPGDHVTKRSAGQAAHLAAAKARQSAATRERVRAALIADAAKSNASIRQEARASGEMVAAERKSLVEQGLILDVRRAKGPLQWSLPDRKLMQTCELFEQFQSWAGEMLERMPASCENALLNPTTDLEKKLHWGFLETLSRIQRIAEALKQKFTPKPRVVAGTEYREADHG